MKGFNTKHLSWVLIVSFASFLTGLAQLGLIEFIAGVIVGFIGFCPSLYAPANPKRYRKKLEEYSQLLNIPMPYLVTMTLFIIVTVRLFQSAFDKTIAPAREDSFETCIVSYTESLTTQETLFFKAMCWMLLLGIILSLLNLFIVMTRSWLHTRKQPNPKTT